MYKNYSHNNLIIKTGAGFYVASSYYLNNVAVTNNSLIVQKSSCYYCSRVEVYCYSNSTSANTGYYIFPNADRISSDSRHYDYTVDQQTYSGVRIRSYSSRTPYIWGIFTCEIPDSEGNTVETSIGIYSSMPSKLYIFLYVYITCMYHNFHYSGAPSVYSSSYTDMSNTRGSVLGTLECLTQYSPPTTVTWLRDGVAVHVDGVGYETMQIVTERQSYSRYKNVLLIRNAAELVGTHTYTCSVSNAAGSNSRSISTTLTGKHIGKWNM